MALIGLISKAQYNNDRSIRIVISRQNAYVYGGLEFGEKTQTGSQSGAFTIRPVATAEQLLVLRNAL